MGCDDARGCAAPREITRWTTSARCSARSVVTRPGAGGTGDIAGALGGLLGSEGGLDGLVKQLSDAGLGEQVQSWVGTGANEPVDPDQLGERARPGQGEPAVLADGHRRRRAAADARRRPADDHQRPDA